MQHPILKVKSRRRRNYWDHRHGFQRKRSTTDQISCIRQLLEKIMNTARQYISYSTTTRKLMIHLGG
jgi:hypothetical protein